MSDQQLEQLEALLAKVQKNRRQGQDEQRAVGHGGQAAAAPVMSAAPRHSEPPPSSARRPAAEQPRRPAAAEKPFNQPIPREDAPAAPAARREPAAPAAPAARREPAAPRAQPAPQAQPQRQVSQAPAEPIVPRVIEPEPPRATNRPIAQLVSKHVTAVDATFGAMLKRSLSLRPH